jgi:hypothetical protein
MSASTATQTRERTGADGVAARVAELRELAASDPAVAASEAWSWIEQLGRRAGSARADAEAELDALFALGRAPQGLDGPTDGILVTPLIQPVVDRALRTITSAWMPWQGKRFNLADSRGDNRLSGVTRWAAKLVWPLYGTKPTAGGRLAFDFETRVEPGEHDPDTEVLVIDYAPIDDNPRLVIKSIRDELVEIVPGANLGKILYRTGDGYRNIGFFALRS